MSGQEDEVPPSETLKQKRYCGLKPFKKGTSGNPSGRLKQHTERVADLRIHADEVPVLAIDKFHAEREEMRKRLPGRQLHAKDHFQPDKVPVDQSPLEVVNFGRVPGSKRIRRL